MRKKSSLLQDYITGGIFASIIAFMVHRYNKRVNPPDIGDDDNNISTTRNPLEFMDAQIKKYVYIYKDYTQ